MQWQPYFSNTKRVVRLVYRGVYGAVFTFCAGATFVNVVGFPASVAGASMRPTFNDPANDNRASRLSISKSSLGSWLGLDVDWVFVNCWAARGFDVRRGEIVIFTSPKGTLQGDSGVC